MTRKLSLLFLATLFLPLLIVFAAPVSAGGWATVGIMEMPEEIEAGRPFVLEFMVWQHGNKPVHDLSWDNDRTMPVTPVVSFGSAEAGQKSMFEAEPAQKQGLFKVEITLPAAGEYVWSIAPEPLAGVTEFEPLTVVPAGTAAAVQKAAPYSVALAGVTVPVWAAAAAVLIAGIAFLTVYWRISPGKQS